MVLGAVSDHVLVAAFPTSSFSMSMLGPASSEAQAWPGRQQVPGLQGGAPCPHGAGSVVFTVTWPGKPARKGLGTISPFLLLPLRSFL